MGLNLTPFHASDSQDNLLAQAVVAAIPGKRHVITDISASYSSSATAGTLQVKRGASVVWEVDIHDSDHFEFETPIIGNENEAVSAELAASGGASNIGKVNIGGYTD